MTFWIKVECFGKQSFSLSTRFTHFPSLNVTSSVFQSPWLPFPVTLDFMILASSGMSVLISSPHFILNWIILFKDDLESCLEMFFFWKCWPDAPKLFFCWPSGGGSDLIWIRQDKWILEMLLTFEGGVDPSYLCISVGFRVRIRGFRFELLHFSSEFPWTNYLTSLYLRFLENNNSTSHTRMF